MRYYELHITMDGDRDNARRATDAVGWKFSAIDGDIVLGAGTKMYATHHLNPRLSPEDAKRQLIDVAHYIEHRGVTVLRRKVELVIFDDRSSKVDACTGGCVECHLDDLTA